MMKILHKRVAAMKIALNLLMVTVAGFCWSAGAANCLRYAPTVVEVSGLLHRATFPGKPNFESIAGGDEPETGFYLTPKQPICTQGDDGPDRQAHAAVTEIQLVLTQAQYARLRPQLGQQVQLRGQLFSSFTGHHHADVLLRVAQ